MSFNRSMGRHITCLEMGSRFGWPRTERRSGRSSAVSVDPIHLFVQYSAELGVQTSSMGLGSSLTRKQSPSNEGVG